MCHSFGNSTYFLESLWRVSYYLNILSLLLTSKWLEKILKDVRVKFLYNTGCVVGGRSCDIWGVKPALIILIQRWADLKTCRWPVRTCSTWCSTLEAGLGHMHEGGDSTVASRVTSGPQFLHTCFEDCMGCSLTSCLLLTCFDFKADERR